MKNIFRCGAILMAGMLAMSAAQAQSSSIQGRWKVRSITSTTYSLDGKEKLKGPFAETPAEMYLTFAARSYVVEESGKRTTYAMRKSGTGYVLTRKAEEGAVTIRLSRIRRTGNALRFTSTRYDAPRRERYVVQWVCEAAPGTEKPRAGLQGTRWQLVEIAYSDDKVVKPSENDVMTLEFLAEGRVGGRAAINRFTGGCTIGADRSLRFGPIASTRAAVPEGSIADTYLRELGTATSYLLRDGMLYLQLPLDTGVMKFRKLTQ